ETSRRGTRPNRRVFRTVNRERTSWDVVVPTSIPTLSISRLDIGIVPLRLPEGDVAVDLERVQDRHDHRVDGLVLGQRGVSTGAAPGNEDELALACPNRIHGDEVVTEELILGGRLAQHEKLRTTQAVHLDGRDRRTHHPGDDHADACSSFSSSAASTESVEATASSSPAGGNALRKMRYATRTAVIPASSLPTIIGKIICL